MEARLSPAVWRYVFGFVGVVDTICAVSGSCRRLRAEADEWLRCARHVDVVCRAPPEAQQALMRRLVVGCRSLRSLWLSLPASLLFSGSPLAPASQSLAEEARQMLTESVRLIVVHNRAHLEELRYGCEPRAWAWLLPALGSCPSLRRLDVELDRANDSNCRALQKCGPSLTGLSVRGHLGTMLGAWLPRGSLLTELWLQRVDLDGLAALAQAPRLLKLDVGPSSVSLSPVFRALEAALRASGAAAHLGHLVVRLNYVEGMGADSSGEICEWRLPALERLSVLLAGFPECVARWTDSLLPGCWRLVAPALQHLVLGLRARDALAAALAVPGALPRLTSLTVGPRWDPRHLLTLCTACAETLRHLHAVPNTAPYALALLATCPALETATLTLWDEDGDWPLASLRHPKLRALSLTGSTRTCCALASPRVSELHLYDIDHVSCALLADCFPALQVLDFERVTDLDGPPPALSRLRDLTMPLGGHNTLRLWLLVHPELQHLCLRPAPGLFGDDSDDERELKESDEPRRLPMNGELWRALPGLGPCLERIVILEDLERPTRHSCLPDLARLFVQMPRLRVLSMPVPASCLDVGYCAPPGCVLHVDRGPAPFGRSTFLLTVSRKDMCNSRK